MWDVATQAGPGILATARKSGPAAARTAGRTLRTAHQRDTTPLARTRKYYRAANQLASLILGWLFSCAGRAGGDEPLI